MELDARGYRCLGNPDARHEATVRCHRREPFYWPAIQFPPPAVPTLPVAASTLPQDVEVAIVRGRDGRIDIEATVALARQLIHKSLN